MSILLNAASTSNGDSSKAARRKALDARQRALEAVEEAIPAPTRAEAREASREDKDGILHSAILAYRAARSCDGMGAKAGPGWVTFADELLEAATVALVRAVLMATYSGRTLGQIEECTWETAGVKTHEDTVLIEPGVTTDGEIDYSFASARVIVLGWDQIEDLSDPRHELVMAKVRAENAA